MMTAGAMSMLRASAAQRKIARISNKHASSTRPGFDAGLEVGHLAS